jgi:hypothetical protein
MNLTDLYREMKSEVKNAFADVLGEISFGARIECDSYNRGKTDHAVVHARLSYGHTPSGHSEFFGWKSEGYKDCDAALAGFLKHVTELKCYLAAKGDPLPDVLAEAGELCATTAAF